MKKMKKRAVGLLVAAIMALGLITPAYAASDTADTGGIGVVLNGEQLIFDDALPVNHDGVVMVPLRGFLEAMGAVVTFDGGAVQAAKEGTSLLFTVQNPEVQVTEDRQTHTVGLEVAPYIDPQTGRTYIPARFAAESFGYSVGWDTDKDAVVVLDIDRLTAGLDEKFTILNKILAADAETTKTPMKLTGEVDYKISVKADPNEAPMEIDMAGDLTGTQFMSGSEMSLNLSIDFEKLLGNLPEGQRELVAPVLKAYSSIPMTVKTDGEKGVTYMKSDIFDLSPIPLPDGRTLNGDAWLKMDLGDLASMPGNPIGVDYGELLKKPEEYMTAESILNLILKGQSSFTVGSYEDIGAFLVFFEKLLGDGAFTRNIGLTVDTYMLNIGKEELKEAAEAAYPLASEATRAGLADVMYALSESPLFDGALSVKAAYAIENGSLRSGEMQVSMDLSGMTQDKTPIKFTMQSIQKGQAEYGVILEMEVADAAVFHIEMQMKMEKTDQKPNLSIPSNAVVIDYVEMISSLMPE